MKAKPRFRVISISQAAKNSTDIFNSLDLFLECTILKHEPRQSNRTQEGEKSAVPEK